MNKKTNNSVKIIDVIISFVALILAVFAYFSAKNANKIAINANELAKDANEIAKNANEIAELSIPSQVVILNSHNIKSWYTFLDDGEGGETGMIGCQEKILLRNLGNRDYSIIGSNIHVTINANSASQNSEKALFGFTTYEFKRIKTVFVSLLSPEMILPTDNNYFKPDEDRVLEMPIPLPKGNDVEIVAWVSLIPNRLTNHTHVNGYIRDDYYPIEVVVSFILNNGEVLVSNPMNCYFIKEE